MSEDFEVVETTEDGKYRVILAHDTGCADPMTENDGWVTSILTRYGYGYGGSDWEAMRDPEGRHAALQHFEDNLVTVEAEAAFIRYMRIFHNVEVREVSIVNGYRDTSNALAWVEPSEAERVGINSEPYFDHAETVKAEVAERNSWAEGETYGYVVQELVTWTAVGDFVVDESGDKVQRTRDAWEDTDSCWGFIGREYAEEAAREALETYVAGVEMDRQVS